MEECDKTDILQHCRTFLEAYLSYVHIYNISCVRIEDKAFDLSIDLELWEEALQHGQKTLTAYSDEVRKIGSTCVSDQVRKNGSTCVSDQIRKMVVLVVSDQNYVVMSCHVFKLHHCTFKSGNEGSNKLVDVSNWWKVKQ
ncbi:hypothetical protein KUTeg_021446 [Tegillarca granosa]|uniref:Uncharacterized protein n=1 Tax=Tegillarca granosa TaxID=220873 RepID=A0ABQ9E7R8_TEGGR|nr:hypothetical protein KUTeg_021446 [Tegillarca granosa]